MPGLGLGSSISMRRGKIALTGEASTSPLSTPNYNSVSMAAPDISLSWGSVNGAEEYVVEHRIDGGAWSEVFRGSGTSTSIDASSNLDAFHEVRVKAVPSGTSSRTESPWRHLPLPKRPSQLALEATGQTSFLASWTPPSWEGSGSDPFYKYRLQAGGESKGGGDLGGLIKDTLNTGEGGERSDDEWEVTDPAIEAESTWTVRARTAFQYPEHDNINVVYGFRTAEEQVTTMGPLSDQTLTLAENTPIAVGEALQLTLQAPGRHPDADYRVTYYIPDPDDPQTGVVIGTSEDPTDDFLYEQTVEGEWPGVEVRARVERLDDDQEQLSDNVETIVVDGTPPEAIDDLSVSTVSSSATLTPTDDTTARQTDPDSTDPGTWERMGVKDSPSDFDREAFIKIDASQIGFSVDTATLRLYLDELSEDGSSALPGTFNVETGEGLAWTESDLTWNNKPLSGSDAAAETSFALEAADVGAFVEIDLTAQVESARLAGTTLTVRIYGNAQEDIRAHFATKENTDSTKHPELTATS